MEYYAELIEYTCVDLRYNNLMHTSTRGHVDSRVGQMSKQILCPGIFIYFFNLLLQKKILIDINEKK